MTSTSRSLVVATLIALTGVATVPCRAADPLSTTAILTSVVAYISSFTGVVSLAFEVAKFFGDYEEVKVMVRPTRYEDRLSYSYRGSSGVRTRTEWLSGDNGPYFRTDDWYFRPDGTYTYRTDSNPFPHALEQRTYSCTTSASMNEQVQSSIQLQIGYDVVRPATLRYFMGPNPLPVTVKFEGNYLTESCLDEPKGGFLIPKERTAPRRAWAPLSLPNSKSMEILAIHLTPH